MDIFFGNHPPAPCLGAPGLREQSTSLPQLEKGARWRLYTPGAGLRASAPASAWLSPASDLFSRNTTTSPQKHQPTAHLCSSRGCLGLVANPPLGCHLKNLISTLQNLKPKCALPRFLNCPTLRACFLLLPELFLLWSPSRAPGRIILSNRPRVSFEEEAMEGPHSWGSHRACGELPCM